MHPDQKHEVILVHTRDEKLRAVMLCASARQYLAMADPREVHADDLETIGPTVFTQRRIVFTEEVDDVGPIINLQIIFRRDLCSGSLVPLFQGSADLCDLADDLGQLLAQRIDEAVAT